MKSYCIAVFLLAGTIGTQTFAQSTIEGEWCTDSEVMFIDSYGIGFNEHTMCKVTNLPVALDQKDTWSSFVSCSNVYVVDVENDGTQEIVEQPADGITMIKLTGAPDGTLVLATPGNDREDMHFLPCSAF